MIRKGIDIDMTNFKFFICREQVNSKIFFVLKKYSKIDSLVLFDENYLYVLKDIVINKKNEKLRRINDIYDLRQLLNYNVTKKQNGFEYTLNFILEKNFLDRKIKKFLFEEKEAIGFETLLLDTLDTIETLYVNDYDEEEDEEEEKEDNKNEDNNIDNKISDNKDYKNEGSNKKLFINNLYMSDARDYMDSKSSSRFVYKNFNI